VCVCVCCRACVRVCVRACVGACVCVGGGGWQQLMLVGHLLPPKGNCKITLNYFVLCVNMWVLYTF
jgi:hypothetical protein